MSAPCGFLMRRLHRNDEKNPEIWCTRWWKLKEAAVRRGTKCYMHGYREKESVVFQIVQACWKKIRCPSDRRALSPHSSSRLHILIPAGAAAWLCPTKAGVTHRVYGMLLHAFAYMCNCVWKFSLSHSVSMSVSSHTASLRRCSFFFFLLLLFKLLNSDSGEWRKWKQGWVSNLSRFWVQAEIWHWRPRQILVYLFIR